MNSTSGQAAPAAGAETPATQPFPIVCIGASSGGLKAISALLAGIPADTGMAFVVIQHLDPHQQSHLPVLLGKIARLPIVEATEGCVLRPDQVYVITPNTRIGIAAGVLRISPRGQGPGPHLAIDAFLGALAADRPRSAIGVILSGTGSDGTLGLAAIRASGGITFAQDASSEYASMPLSAIGQGQVDFVLRPAEIAKELVKIAKYGFPLVPPAAERPCLEEGVPDAVDAEAVDPVAYAAIIALLRTATGIDFTHYRATTITRRTRRRMALLAKTSLADYARHLAAVPQEVDALAKDVLINVTSFFRDRGAFAALATTAFPALLAGRAAAAPIRIWVVGCSTGQEVYSLVIELLEFLKGVPAAPRVQVFATDISDWALARARLGCYGESIADEVPADRLARYFTREPSGFRVSKELREVCVFSRHDVTADTPFSRIDLISCRNVLIYLGPVLQKYVLPTFHFSLKPDGFLLLGTSETLGRAASLFATVDEKNRLYRTVASPGRLRPPVPQPRPGDTSMPIPPQPLAQPLSAMQHAADQVVLGRFAPAGVLVSETMEIIQFRGHTAPYLEPAQGEASLNLLTMVPFGMAEALRVALAEAKSSGLTVRREAIALRREQDFREIGIEVIPIRLPTGLTGFLILFAEQGPTTPAATSALPAPVAAAAAGGPGPDAQENARLRAELAAATDYVHALVALNHTQVEQLRDAQEEAQSSTEEYRSTNEELQTAKEEVESTNEELVTINEELRAANTELAKASSALRTSGDLTSAIIETMRYPLLVLSAQLRVESANQAFLAAFGVDRAETIGNLVYDLGNGQWNIPELRRLLEDILPNNSTFDDFEVTHDFANIGPMTMLLNARRLEGGDDHARLIVLVIADITARARVSLALQDTAIEQLRSNAELEQFAAVASHDLQEPLRMMSSYIGLLQARYGPVFDARALEYMAHVTDGAKRMSSMINAILTYSRLGQEACDVVEIDSAFALGGALANLSAKIADAHAVIAYDGLPCVRANCEQLTQLFQNLLGNAVKYGSSKRAPLIRVSATESAQEWVFAVADNGIGMAEGDLERIFEPFTRVHRKGHVQGSGIGLATCKKIVEHHQGRIWVESTLDVGSTFFFSLPKRGTPAA